MTTLHKYRLYCVTDGKYEYTWGEDTEPTVCPTNTTHTIDATQTTIVDTLSKNVVSVVEETTPTGGNFRGQAVVIVAEASDTTTKELSWPYPISILSISFNTTSEHQEDVLSVAVAPNTIIGVLAADAAVDDNVLYVSPNIFDILYVGYNVTLFDGVNTEKCGKVLNMDSTDGTITVENALTQTFDSATPTYVQQTIYTIENYEIGPPF